MEKSAIRQQVVEELKRIAPELEEAGLDEAKPLRDQVDLDSMDWLNFLVALHERTGKEIPESDYKKLGTLSAIVDDLA